MDRHSAEQQLLLQVYHLERRAANALDADEPWSAAGPRSVAPFVPCASGRVTPALRAARLCPSDVLWDLGCGDGRLLHQAALQYGCRCVGIDIDTGCIAEARRRAEEQGVSNLCQFQVGDLLSLTASDLTTGRLGEAAPAESRGRVLPPPTALIMFLTGHGLSRIAGLLHDTWRHTGPRADGGGDDIAVGAGGGDGGCDVAESIAGVVGDNRNGGCGGSGVGGLRIVTCMEALDSLLDYEAGAGGLFDAPAYAWPVCRAFAPDGIFVVPPLGTTPEEWAAATPPLAPLLSPAAADVSSPVLLPGLLTPEEAGRLIELGESRGREQAAAEEAAMVQAAAGLGSSAEDRVQQHGVVVDPQAAGGHPHGAFIPAGSACDSPCAAGSPPARPGLPLHTARPPVYLHRVAFHHGERWRAGVNTLSDRAGHAPGKRAGRAPAGSAMDVPADPSADTSLDETSGVSRDGTGDASRDGTVWSSDWLVARLLSAVQRSDAERWRLLVGRRAVLRSLAYHVTYPATGASSHCDTAASPSPARTRRDAATAHSLPGESAAVSGGAAAGGGAVQGRGGDGRDATEVSSEDVERRDSGSLLTLRIPLSGPGRAVGGELLFPPQAHPTAAATEPFLQDLGDGALFVSEKRHRVSRVESGRRHELVLEIWDGAVTTFDRHR